MSFTYLRNAGARPRLRVAPSEPQRELGVLAHPVGSPGRREHHRRHDLLHPVELAHELLHLLADLWSDRAARAGEREGDVDPPAVHLDLVDEAQLDEVE